jgi:hypothetical protein
MPPVRRGDREDGELATSAAEHAADGQRRHAGQHERAAGDAGGDGRRAVIAADLQQRIRERYVAHG